MADDLLAARIDDPLMHSSPLADCIGALVEGAIYAGAIAACTFGGPVGIAVGAGVIAAMLWNDNGDKINRGVTTFIDALFGTSSPDARIATGSGNVLIMGKGAARAAGTVDRDYLNNPAAFEHERSLWEWTVLGMTAVGAVMSVAINPGGALASMLYRNGHFTLDGVKQWANDFATSMAQPVVESASPHATPAPLDVVDCTKGHVITENNFLAEGSRKVMINGQPAVRNGHRSTCEAEVKVSENTRVRIGGDSIVVRDIHSGRNMLAYYAGALMGSLGVNALVRKLLWDLGIKEMLRQAARKEFICPLIANAAASGATTFALSGVTNAAATTGMMVLSGATQTAHPVNIATGAKILAEDDDLDFTLPDRIPLIWQRIYHSRNLACGMLGTGWSLPFETRLLRLEDNHFLWRDMTGRELALGQINPGTAVFYEEEGLQVLHGPNGALVLRTSDGETQLYEPDPTRAGEWRIRRIYDRHENVQHFSWNEKGRLVRISGDNESLDVVLVYGTAHQRLTEVHQVYGGERHLLVRYDYNPQGQLVRVTDADGIVTRQYGWDGASGLMAWHSYATGLEVHYQWQPSVTDRRYWRVSGYQVQDGRGGVLERWRLEADEAQRSATLSNDGGLTTRHCWDSLFRITGYTDAQGGEWRFGWSAAGERVTSVTQPDGARWDYGYDERGNLTLVRDPLGNATLAHWHPLYAFPLKEVQPDGAVWEYRYNVSGDVVRLTDPKGGVTRYEWNDQGDLLKQTDPLENTHRYWWNERGQLVRDEDCSGNLSDREYDAAGRLIRATDAEGGTDRWYWSAAGRLQRYVRADGRETRYEYDRAGLLCGENGDGLRERKVTRNVRGQVVRATDPAGHVTQLHYDRFGRLVTLENANRERWQFEYDAAGRLTGQRDYAGRLTAYRHDAAGRVVEVTRYPLAESGLAPLSTGYEYDPLGRMTARETATQRTEYRYGALTLEIRRTAYEDWRQAQAAGREPQWQETLRFTRNAAGELVSEENHGGKYEYHYDALSNLSSTQYPDGRALNCLRYGTGHLLEMQLRHGGQVHALAGYGRDRLHREVTRSQGVLTLETRYDAAGRITLRRSAQEARHRLVSERRYRWDGADQIVQQIQTDGEPLLPAEKYRQTLYGYDAAGQVTRTVGPQAEERFWYDPAGNRTDATLQPVWHNLLQRLNGRRWQYDGFGRLRWRRDSNGTEQYFSYDDDQQVSEIRFTGHPEFSRVAYRYDALGRRTRKILWRHNDPQPEITRFDWQGLQLAGEQNEGEPSRYVQYLYSEGSYEPLARVDSQGDSSEVYWYHTELNGLPERMTDAEGNTVWRGRFSTWGETVYESSAGRGQVAQNLRFQGQYLDRESGLHYNVFRYYDPLAGRYTQMDPIGLLGGLNTYSYVGDPLTWVDPLGLAIADCSKNVKALRTGPQGTVITVKSKKEAHELLSEAFPDAQKVKGIGSQDAEGIRRKRKMEQFKKRDGIVRYRKDYPIDSTTGRVYGHDDPKGTGHGSLPHINIKRADGTMVRIDIDG